MICSTRIEGHKKAKFTKDEDELLVGLVKEYGFGEWDKISKRMNGRSKRQCRERYKLYLSPNVDNGPWNDDEDKKLIQLFKVIGPKWTELSTYFCNRTDVNIKSRWKVLERKLVKENSTSFLKKVKHYRNKKKINVKPVKKKEKEDENISTTVDILEECYFSDDIITQNLFEFIS